MKSFFSRLGYWLLKYLLLALLLAVVAAIGYGLWLLALLLFNAGQVVGSWLAGVNWKRGFYSVCMLVIFFYAARAMRGLALWIESKARKERQ